MRPSSRHRLAPAPGRGFSLVELLVSMAIGLVLTLAVTRVLLGSQESKLTTTSVNDTNQNSNYLAFLLDRTIRSAGSGYAQRGESFGCVLTAARSGTTILPRSTDFPAPFASISRTQRLAPVMVFRGASSAGSDVIAVMTGTAGFGESASSLVKAAGVSGQIQVPNTLGYRANDMVLLTDGLSPCMVQQVASGFTEIAEQNLALGGIYANATIGTVNQTTFQDSGSSFALALGSAPTTTTAASANPPEFKLFGVGDNNTLFSYDMLRNDGSNTSVPVADGVVEMRAIFHVDTDSDGDADAWHNPGASTNTGYTTSELLPVSGTTPAPTAAAATNLRRIVALRVGLILRTSMPEKDNVALASYTLFAGLAGETTRTLSTDERKYRHRVLEVTIPVRNILIAPAP